MLRRWEGRGVECVCDPWAMMTRAMVGAGVGDDFVERVLETLAPNPWAAFVVIQAGLSAKQVEIATRFAVLAGKRIVSKPVGFGCEQIP